MVEMNEERFKRWQEEMCEVLDDIKDDINDIKFNPNSPGTSKRWTTIIEPKIKELWEYVEAAL